MTREEAIKHLDAMIYNSRIVKGIVPDEYDIAALRMAIEALSAEAKKPNMKSWNGLYIKVYADDDPQDKAEKLYQICDSNEALSEVAKCIQGYLDEPSVDYERATDQMEHDIAYEPTYNSEDGSM